MGNSKAFQIKKARNDQFQPQYASRDAGLSIVDPNDLLWDKDSFAEKSRNFTSGGLESMHQSNSLFVSRKVAAKSSVI